MSGIVVFSLLTKYVDIACPRICALRISVGIAARAWAEVPGQEYWAELAASVSSASSEVLASASAAALGM